MWQRRVYEYVLRFVCCLPGRAVDKRQQLNERNAPVADAVADEQSALLAKVSSQTIETRSFRRPSTPFALTVVWHRALTPHASCTLCIGASPTPHSQPRLLQRLEFPDRSRNDCQWSLEAVQLSTVDLGADGFWYPRAWIIDANRQVVWTTHAERTEAEPRSNRLLLLLSAYKARRVYARTSRQTEKQHSL